MISTLAVDLSNVLESHPQTRRDLCRRLGCKDRALRDAVKELREMGYNIASTSDNKNKGYWLGDEADRQRTIKEYRSREAKCRKIADALEKGPDIGQMEMEL